ncbi:MAG: hypothetical protein MK102_05135 [Fuerstiella sp.]|nr:hypothetical protein [Fuerstiella sp.]
MSVLSTLLPDAAARRTVKATVMSLVFRRAVLLVLWCLFTSTGCQTTAKFQERMISAYDRGEADEALSQLECLADRRDNEPDITSLNRAILYLLDFRPESAIRELEFSRKRLDYLQQVNVTEQAVSALNDDSSVAWIGHDFERRMVDNLQVIASLIQNDDDVFALASRGMNGVFADERILNRSRTAVESNESETVLQSDPVPARFAANRMTAWLAAASSSERILDADVTDRLMQQVAVWEPSGNTGTDALQTLGTRSSRDSGTLQVVTLAGRISRWKSKQIIPTTAALLLADRVLSVTSDNSLPPTNVPVRIARPVRQHYQPTFLTHISVAGEKPKRGRLLVDLNAAAWDAWQAGRDQQIARAVVRRVVKKGVVYGAGNALDVRGGSVADLLLNVAGLFWEAHEQADLRQWNLLPAAVEVVQMELPAGNHRVNLQVFPSNQQASGIPADQVELPVTIEDGRNTFVVCFRPYSRLAGVQCSRPADR